ncbi:MAG: WD40 repeat domain-containing protein [Armatimonadetes bacterium]|nr:WD40 repeat domain-containing protein [Armatimonadota bacterium]
MAASKHGKLILVLLALLGFLVGGRLDLALKPAEGTLLLSVDRAETIVAPDGRSVAIVGTEPSSGWRIQFRSSITGKTVGPDLQLQGVNRHWGTLSEDGRYYCWRQGDRLRTWDVKSGRLLYESMEPDGIGLDRLSRDGRRLLHSHYRSGTGRPDEILWAVTDTASGRHLVQGRTLAQQFGGIDMSGDGHRFALSTAEETAIYALPGGRRAKRLREGPGHIHTVHGGRWFSLQHGRNLRLYDFANGKPVSPVLPHGTSFCAVMAVDDRTKRAASWGLDGRLLIWDLPSGRLLREEATNWATDMSRDGKLTGTTTGAAWGAEVTVRELESERVRFRLSKADDESYLQLRTVQQQGPRGVAWVVRAMPHSHEARVEAWEF